MSTLSNPPPEGPHAERALSPDEQGVLDGIAGRENASDPGFVARLGAGPERRRSETTPRQVASRGRRRDAMIQVAVVLVIAAVLLPTAWVVTGLVTALLLGLPLALVFAAWRESRQATARGEGHRRPFGTGHDEGPAAFR